MKKIIFTVLIIVVSTLPGCSNKTNTVSSLDTTSPTVASEPTTELNNPSIKEKTYCFDATKELDAIEYKNKTGMDLNYFSSPIESPYKYTYLSDNNSSINVIANELGKAMLEDLMKDYDGKTFTVTEYRNLEAHVMNEGELNDWKERYSKLGKKVELSDNQWLCSYSCEYKYIGNYSGIGAMPADLEWMDTLIQDGSGEDYVFIIQKTKDNEYIMRALPKTVIELKE